MALDFKLSDEFVNSYKDKEVPWGYKDGAGNSLGEITTLRTYSRVKEDGTKEKWHEICRRVIEGMFTLQKRHARQNRIEWKNDKAQRTAKDAYDRMFNMKWLPPGRGIWSMGSPLVMDDNNSAPLQNCAACSSEESVVEAAVFLFDASMLGVGVGFDSLGANKFPVLEPEGSYAYVIPDSREGWVESLRLLLAAYIDEGKKRNPLPVMDYSEVRPAGAPIKRFGGIASGPGPLKDLHEKVKNLLDSRVGSKITMRDINDIMNMIGVAVIAGNVRRCLPEGTKVHLTDGLKNIEDVTPGDIVETTGRRAKVTKVFDQGVQETVLIKYDGGELECTPNHRVAVFDSLTSWTFKRADELTTKDRVVFDRNGYTGRYTSLPPSTVPVLKHNTTGVRIEVPPLTPDVAWLLGLIHGDGYVSVPPSGKNVGSNSGEVVIACSPDYPKVVEDSVLALSSFGVAALERTYSHDRATRVRAHSTELARYLLDFKTPTQTIEIPEYIVNGKREVRASYLAGLFDSDGSSKTRPLRALSTIYPDFADQVSSLYATLGIQARVKLSRPARGNWKDLYSVNIVGPHNIQGWADIVSPFSRKEPEVKLGVRSSGGATFDTDTVRRSSYRGSGIRCTNGTGSRQCAFRIEKALVGSLPALPYQVREVVPSGRSIQTYDIEVEDLHQFTANGIVVHNSAELSLVDSDSPDVQEFTDLKDYDKNPDRVGHGFMANNSIRVNVGDDYTPFLEGIKLNGEPGFVWKDISTSYSRLKDAPDFKDVRATLVNPCSFSGDTLVHTTEGAKTIESLKDRPFWALVDGEAFFSPVGSYVTGQKDLFRLETEEGYEVTLTDNHEVLTESGEWVEAGKLNAGDKIVLHNHRDAPFFPGEGSWDEGYLIGNLVGDGNLVQSGHGRLSVWDNGDPESAQAMMTQMEESIDRVYNGLSNIRSDAKTKFTPRVEPFNMYYMSLSGKLLSKFDVVYGNKTTTPKIEASSSDFHRGYLRGLFDADGHLEGVSNDKGLSVRLGQSDLKSLKAVQRMLLRFGIKSSIRKAKDAGEALLPDGRGGHKLYPTKESWRLIVSADSVFLFQEYIGFTHTAKKTNLRRGVESKTRGFYRTKYTATFKSLTYERFDDVWDLSVSTKKAFDANGLYVHNSEQNLESGETCTLCEVFIGNCTNQDDFIKTLKVAFMYGKTVTLLPTKWEKTNAILLRNRRIGLSVSGVADYVDAHGLPALRKSLDDGYNYVTKLDKKYSEWLCVRESVKRTTVKPAGSISLVAGSSPGVHWTPGGEYFIRRITFAKTDPLFEALKDAGYEHSDLEWDPKSAVILFPIHSKSKRSAADVPAWEKINLAAEMQHWWSDNAVSCTVDFKPAEAGDIPKLLNMYEGRLKGISFLPAIEKGAYKNMPYEQISKDTYEEMKSTIRRADFTHVYSQGIEAVGEAFCTSDKCETEIETNAMTLEVPTINLDEV